MGFNIIHPDNKKFYDDPESWKLPEIDDQKYPNVSVKSFFVKLGILLIIVIILGLVSREVFGQSKINGIDTQDIIMSYEKPEIIYNSEKKDYELTGETEVVFKYRSNIPALQETDEILEKRTENSITYNNGKMKIYAGQAFSKENENWYYVETSNISKMEWDRATEISWIEKLLGKQVFADDYYVGAGDGKIDTYSGSSNWDTEHDKTAGDRVFDDVDNEFNVFSYENGGNYYIGRLFLPIDTSAIDDGATITSASLYVYTSSQTNNDNDGQNYLAIVETNTASNTELTANDFNDCGDSVDDPTLLSAQVDMDTIVDETYVQFSLNATGISVIDKEGYTPFGMREGHDIEDDAVVAPSAIEFEPSEETGTNKDPYLVIELEEEETETPLSEIYGSASIAEVSAFNLNYIIWFVSVFVLFFMSFNLVYKL